MNGLIQWPVQTVYLDILKRNSVMVHKCPCEHKRTNTGCLCAYACKLSQSTRSLNHRYWQQKHKGQKLPVIEKNICVKEKRKRWWKDSLFFLMRLFLRDWGGDRELTFGVTHSPSPDVQIDFSDLFMSVSGENMLYLLTKYPAALDKKAKTVQWQCKQLFHLTFKKYPCEKINTETLFEEAILQVSL